MTSASQIASHVLAKLAADESWNATQLAATGLAAGTGFGALATGVEQRNRILQYLQNKGQIPKQQQARQAMSEVLKQIREQIPDTAAYNDVTLAHLLTRTEQLPGEAHHVLRKGLEEGVAGGARTRRLPQILKAHLLRSARRNVGIGAGLGLGAGLFGALGTGAFDRE